MADVGVPLRRPVELLNVAHAGLFAIEYVSVSLSGSLADGWNEYVCVACTDVAGEPLIVGARLFEFTWIENAGSAVLARPSLTLMTMFEYVATLPDAGAPDSMPLDVLKLAHEGRFEIENISVSPFASLADGWKA